jgi:hypothetical protein
VEEAVQRSSAKSVSRLSLCNLRSVLERRTKNSQVGFIKMIPYKIHIVQTWRYRDKDRHIAIVVDLFISWNQIPIFITTCGMEMRYILISRG